ncbi:tRNA (adenosine(37)-N6)-threonylcarbamoyltransferase complex dimerization subunit type 1 TsaB [Candidatus Saccharibacteria bacterium]|nr:tRNA (adenosine(37)-N6)-threonylcarbamoyltransferase complex dimerization subunit type 1 TsaB [Candidatus Saccharibacteria bacterium]
MKLYLDTSTPICILKLDEKTYKSELGRDMAEKLHAFIKSKLDENGKKWSDITEIEFMSGPGSFTGLRIGASVVNTLADQLDIPLYDHHGVKHQIIIPDYGRPANISAPRK